MECEVESAGFFGSKLVSFFNASGVFQPSDKLLRQNNQGNRISLRPGIILPVLNLFIPLFMAILSQSFFTLMRRNFMTLSFFTTRHTEIIFLRCFLINDFILISYF
jgi:hypothetical protein